LLSAILLLSSYVVSANPLGQIPQIPAFLPSVNQVPATKPSPIDGTWIIDAIGKTVRIQSGRAYAVDGWLHLFVLKISPGMVVIKNVSRTRPGEYSGDDLPLMGKWTARIQPNRQLAVSVASAIPANYTMTPINLDNQRWFNKEMSKAGIGSGSAPPSYSDEDDYRDDGEGDYREDDEDDYREDDEDDYRDDDEDDYRDDEDDYRDDDEDDYRDDEDDYRDDDEDEGWEDEEWDEGEEWDEEEEAAPKQVKAKKYKKAKVGCEGKQVYRSGTKCYSCPNGYKRAKLSRKMTHPEACMERGAGFNKDTTKAQSVWGANGCPRYQFKYKGYCWKCPKDTKRKQIAGLDSGYCKVLY
jgi:hypothetical protein